MPTKNNSTKNITLQDGTINIREKLNEQVETILEVFSFLLDDLKKGSNKNFEKIEQLEDLVNIRRNKIASDAIYELTKSAFAKDLRRIVTYLQVNNLLELISDEVINIYGFLDLILKKYKLKLSDIDYKFMEEMIASITRSLKDLETLLETEDDKLADQIIANDAKINKIYKNFIQLLSEDKLIKSSVKTKRKELQLGFVLAIKNLERSGDNIKRISKTIKYINNDVY